MTAEQILFVTGRLAEHSLRNVLRKLAAEVGFEYSIEVLNITVAALMTTEWVAQRLDVPAGTERVLLPGYCQGELVPIAEKTSASVERGPRDLRRLPEYFGQTKHEDYGGYQIEILAEINHAPQLSLAEILKLADRYRQSGADLIDVGCIPGTTWPQIGDTVRALREQGHRVSIDSMRPDEIAAAVKAGAELVLSVNSSNVRAAGDWGCEVVAIPDAPSDLDSLDATVEQLADAKVPLRIDPILEPIGFGFANSLLRYFEVRRRYPDAEMMMGIGNLSELTDVDSAGVNVVLLAICEELGIRSVLTTEVINWAGSSVRECDLGRRLVHYANEHKTLPKHIEPRLVMLRDTDIMTTPPELFRQLAADIKDANYRIFAEDGQLHLISAGLHLVGSDPFVLFEELMATGPKNVDPNHAFYLGYEFAKAVTALTLSKQYRQDESLDWGFLTREENSHRLQRSRTDRNKKQAGGKETDA